LRKLNLKCIILEKAPRSGGVWYWNCYPGARVDTPEPVYQIPDPELWEGFDFRERYPGRDELCRYFDHVDSKLNFSKDTWYGSKVIGAKWDNEACFWEVKYVRQDKEGGLTEGKVKGRWFIAGIGLSGEIYKPKIEGMELFKGQLVHSAEWPQTGIDLKDKSVAVIGTGASGVQIIQEIAPITSQLTVYQRTPNFCLPMVQRSLSPSENKKKKSDGTYQTAFNKTLTTFAGFPYDFLPQSLFSESFEKREELFQSLMEEGGFGLWLNNYHDVYSDEKANEIVYEFWRDRIRKRIQDENLKEKLAPMKQPHPFGTKRPSLEINYYECFNLPHVDLIDLNENPILKITQEGIKTKDDEKKFDLIILATGFNALTKGMENMNVKNDKDESISDHWSEGVKTTLGMMVNGFPNLFMIYGPQAPSAFGNGPISASIQGNWLGKVFEMVKEKGIVKWETKKDEEEKWTLECREVWGKSLFPNAKSWYQGSNIPGKRVEALNYIGGIPRYIKALDKSLEDGLKAWDIKYDSSENKEERSTTTKVD
ncbi:hypothetical protein TREMEDRAFT_26263, partial [Tremella mesenterica DSM 1558]|uniref:uncharacterized protein n=1 Tax=Tremella mesenterica (strain ATCC 24925 / CBS 8224 / DSM 1558 / NBRC 9311 / NRRL Y-6157 / RJB 2259-6 / UBC 559-6) TaxID=578456 RepID=UPI0003F494B9